MAVTPGREVWLEVDGPAYSTVVRPMFWQNWGAADIGKSDSWVVKVLADGTLLYADGHERTELAPGGTWALSPFRQYKFSTVTGDFPGAIIAPSDWTVAPNIKFQNLYRPPTDLPGVGGGGFTTVNPGMRRRVPAGQSWDHADNRLGADQTTYPPPVDPQYPVDLPVDRVARSNPSYEKNMGFMVTFGVDTGFYGSPIFLRFYFGGPALMEPTGAYGGEFCLTLRGDGRAILYERDLRGTPPVYIWVRRTTFQWAAPNTVTGRSHTIMIWPMARDRIVFKSAITDQPAISGIVMPPLAFGHHNDPTAFLYRDSPGQTGHLHQDAQTGQGQARLDLMRNYRAPVAVWLLKFPENGYVIDQPFLIPAVLPAGQPIQVFVNGFALGTPTGINARMFNAETGVELTKDAFGQHLAHQSQMRYYVRFDFFSSDNRNQTPVLFDYEVRVSPNVEIREKIAIAGKVRDGSVTGPDVQPGHASANVQIRDRNGVFAILRAHDRRYCRVKVVVPTTGPSGDPRGYVILHAGETWQPKAQLRGREGLGNTQWFDYSVNIVDMWLRVQKQLSRNFPDYRYDRAAPDPTSPGGYAPPLVLAVIRDLLMRAGVPEDELDTPGWDDPTGLRLWGGPVLLPDDWLVTPGVDISNVIKRLAFDTLGKIIIHDPNAFNETNPNRGIWRVLDPPDPVEPDDPMGDATYDPSNSKCWFYVRRPAATTAGGPYVVEEEGALFPVPVSSISATYIKDESYFLYPQAPEATALLVTGTGSLNADGKGNQNLTQQIFNPKAVSPVPGLDSADPNSISFMDRWEPIYVNDPTFRNELAINYMTARIARQALNGRLWCEFVSPLVFIKDPGDPLLGTGSTERRRPLRVYDQITVVDEHGNPHPAMVRNCNPFWTGARDMWQHVQALLLDAR